MGDSVDYSVTMMPSDTEVLTEFSEFVRVRAGAGVVLARSVKDIAFANGYLLVTVSPEEAQFTSSAVYSTSAFDNFADLFGVPIAFDNEQGKRLRRAVRSITVTHIDGTTLGTRSANELYRIGTGEDLPDPE